MKPEALIIPEYPVYGKPITAIFDGSIFKADISHEFGQRILYSAEYTQDLQKYTDSWIRAPFLRTSHIVGRTGHRLAHIGMFEARNPDGEAFYHLLVNPLLEYSVGSLTLQGELGRNEIYGTTYKDPLFPGSYFPLSAIEEMKKDIGRIERIEIQILPSEKLAAA